MPLNGNHVCRADAGRAREAARLTRGDDKWVAALQDEDRVVAGAISGGSPRLATSPGNCHTWERDTGGACRRALADRA